MTPRRKDNVNEPDWSEWERDFRTHKLAAIVTRAEWRKAMKEARREALREAGNSLVRGCVPAILESFGLGTTAARIRDWAEGRER